MHGAILNPIKRRIRYFTCIEVAGQCGNCRQNSINVITIFNKLA